MFKNKLFFFLQSCLRYFPFKVGVWLREVFYRPFFKRMGKNTRIMDAVVIKYPDEIELGDNLTINQFCYLVGKGGLKIGNDVMVGAGSKITTTAHNVDSVNTPMIEQGISYSRIIIGNDVWLGFNVVVLGGSKIGNGSILAANSVVNSKEFNDFVIIGGVPAKVIGERR